MNTWMDLLRGIVAYINGIAVNSGRALTFNFIGAGIAGAYNPESGNVEIDFSDLAGGGGGSGGVSYAFDSSLTTTSDPGAGNFRLNNATLSAVSSIAISDVNSDGANVEAFLLAQDDSSSSVRGTITIRRASSPSTYAAYKITGASVDSSGWVQFAVTYIGSQGSFAAGNGCSIVFSRTGDAGTTGANGASASIQYAFDTGTTTSADPGSGNFRFNNATLASVTAAAFSDVDSSGGNNELYLLAQDDSTTTAHRGYIIVRKLSAPSTFAIFDITGTSTNSSGWVQFVLTYVTASGSFSASDACGIEFHRTGDAASGAQGIVGNTYLFATSTTTNADPSAGNFRLNNATASSVTAAAFADTDANGNNVEAFLLAQDDSTTTAHRGYLWIRSRTTPATFRIYDITGTSTDSAGWVQFVLTHVASNGTLASTEPCDILFSRTGDTGATGPVAGSNGQLLFNSGGAAAGATITTTGSDLNNVTAVNGVPVTLGALGTALADSDATLSVAGGSNYHQTEPFTSNHVINLSESGATDDEGIEISRHVTDGCTLTVNDSLNQLLYMFPANEKRRCSFKKEAGVSGKFKRGSHQKIQ